MLKRYFFIVGTILAALLGLSAFRCSLYVCGDGSASFSLLPVETFEIRSPAGRVIVNQLEKDEAENSVSCVITIKDGNGMALPLLNLEDLTVYCDDRRMKDLRLQRAAPAPLNLCLAIDTSASMNEPPKKFATVLAAARRFVEDLDNTSVALFSFGGGVDCACGFTKDRDRILGAIDGLKLGGRTVLYDCLDSCSRLLSGRTGRRALVILTDGYDTGHRTGVSELVALCGQRRVPVFALAIGREADRVELLRLARKTGGDFFLVPTLRTLSDALQRLSAQLSAQTAVVLLAGRGENDPPRPFVGLLCVILCCCAFAFIYRQSKIAANGHSVAQKGRLLLACSCSKVAFLGFGLSRSVL